jgi:hypothetical protein
MSDVDMEIQRILTGRQAMKYIESYHLVYQPQAPVGKSLSVIFTAIQRLGKHLAIANSTCIRVLRYTAAEKSEALGKDPSNG